MANCDRTFPQGTKDLEFSGTAAIRVQAGARYWRLAVHERDLAGRDQGHDLVAAAAQARGHDPPRQPHVAPPRSPVIRGVSVCVFAAGQSQLGDAFTVAADGSPTSTSFTTATPSLRPGLGDVMPSIFAGHQLTSLTIER